MVKDRHGNEYVLTWVGGVNLFLLGWCVGLFSVWLIRG